MKRTLTASATSRNPDARHVSSPSPPPLDGELPICDEVLATYASAIGADLTGYRHHVHRVAHLCAAQLACDDATWERVQVAAAFHDLGIWTDRTFDYLRPSIALASDYLTARGQAASLGEISAMILEHHKLRPYRGDRGALVEVFRRADWIDVTCGVRTFGVPRDVVRALYTRWPGAGFHRRLVGLTASRLRSHPWSPLPMVRF